MRPKTGKYKSQRAKGVAQSGLHPLYSHVCTIFILPIIGGYCGATSIFVQSSALAMLGGYGLFCAASNSLHYYLLLQIKPTRARIHVFVFGLTYQNHLVTQISPLVGRCLRFSCPTGHRHFHEGNGVRKEGPHLRQGRRDVDQAHARWCPGREAKLTDSVLNGDFIMSGLHPRCLRYLRVSQRHYFFLGGGGHFAGCCRT